MAPLPVFLIHYDAPHWVRSAAKSILASDIEVDLTVISNSGPVTVPGARVMVTDRNVGYAGGGNIAFREWLSGSEPFVLVGSHDLHVEPDALRLLRVAMEANETVGIAGPLMPDAPGGQAGDGTVTWLSGQGAMYRRECIEEIGGFDERFGSYTEDREIGERASSRFGWSLVRVDDAHAHGLGSAIGDEWAVRRRFWPGTVGLERKLRGDRAGLQAIADHTMYLRSAVRHMTVSLIRRRPDWRYHARHIAERARTLPACVHFYFRFRASTEWNALAPEPAGRRIVRWRRPAHNFRRGLRRREGSGLGSGS